MEQFSRNLDLEEKKADKLERYIFREQEYRRVIQDLKDEIERVSQRPLEERKEKTED